MTTIASTLADEARTDLEDLARANAAEGALFPGDRGERQPVHTVYGGAHLFRAGSAQRLGQLALASLERHAPDASSFAAALGLPDRPGLASTVYERVKAKLEREPVEDLRIDFEDGFGPRSDVEEDETAIGAARELARAMREKTLPPFVGIRIKALDHENTQRSVRTLDLFVSTVVAEAGALPDGFVVTLPKITVAEQPRTLVRLFERLEHRLSLSPGALRMEMMVELTRTLVHAEGYANLPRLLRACEGRCRGAHFGTYDYTASCDVAATRQTMDHPHCGFALSSMKSALAGTGVFLSDGATNVLPVGQDTAVVHAAWRAMYANVRASLANGFYQGWDLHPAQMPVRYAAVHAFFLEGFDAVAERLRSFVDAAARATLVGSVFDDAATGQGLLNFFLRALASGAVSDAELAVTGLTSAEIRTRSFAKILDEDPMIEDWLHFALRLFHLIAGIMWIGTSFYFVWLDYSFEPLAEKKEGVEGETYMVHGGFFYRVEKQRPITLPRNLHWFKYEALLTWISGVFLLLLVYWTGGGMSLVDYVRFPMHPHVAMTVSGGTLVVGWVIYDLLWKFVGPRAPTVALITSLALLLGAIYGLCFIFPGRAAFIHVGAMLGTIMIANVWMRILPGQRRMIAARIAGKEPNWAEGAAAKHRSLHNSYMTIPVLATMVSNDFSSAFDHPLNWVLLSVICVVGASARHLMITVERKQTAWWALAPAILGVAALVVITWPTPPPVDTTPPVAFAEANDVITRRCRQCHSATPTDDVFHTAPNGVTFDTPDSVRAYAPRIRLRAVVAQTMPLANDTAMTPEERELLRRWIDQGARL